MLFVIGPPSRSPPKITPGSRANRAASRVCFAKIVTRRGPSPCGTRTRRIFPLCFGRQTIGLAGFSIQFFNIALHVIPTDIFNRQIIAFSVASRLRFSTAKQSFFPFYAVRRREDCGKIWRRSEVLGLRHSAVV